MLMKKFEVIGLEMHSRSMWYHAHVKKALDFMADNGFNALIFHQSDILNHLVYPSKYLNSQIMWEKFCALRAFEIENNRLYINNIIEEAAKRGIDFYFNLKEIFYTDEIVELFPHLIRQKGTVCPTDPFWWEYIEACIEDLCETIPNFKGVILSNGTHESRTSITKRNRCECERCKNVVPDDWYYEGFKAVYKPLAKHRKKFIIRDFAFSAENQDLILSAGAKVDKNVIMSLKNTPHDYFPTFPNNPRIGTTGQEEWVEFDTWGQFYGGGFFPVSVAEDMKQRLQYCYEKGVKGVFFRTDWEGMYENSTFSSPNMINLYAAGLLSNNVDADLDEAYKKWAKSGWNLALKCDSYNADPIPPTNPDAWKNMRDFIKASWEVMRKTVYVRGHWFCEDNMFPDSIDKAFKMLIHIHGRDDWEPGASLKVKVTDENLKIIFDEKQQAIKECEALKDILNAESLGFPQEVIEDINTMLEIYKVYCNIGNLSCRTVFLSQRAIDSGDKAHKEEALQAINDLRDYTDYVKKFLDNRTHFYHHIVFWLINVDRMESLANDAYELVTGARKQVFNTFIKG